MSEYCLRWNNHQPNLVTVFSELLNAEALVDVTLATDGHFIHAHKLVLSACSVYFKDLFGSNPCKHPIVFLKDIKIEDLKTVIDFIYRGEVNVSQERLQDVLKTAESLRIKGLADKPFSYDEYPSQSRSGGQHLSSSFSSQRSSLTDSREQTQSIEGEDGAEGSGNSPPATKKRKVVSSQDSGEFGRDTNHEGEDRQRGDGKDDSQKKSSTVVNDEGANKSSSKDKVKEEKEGTNANAGEGRPEYPETRAADAMLLLQGSSSEGGADEGNATPITSANSRADSNASGLMSPQSQSRSKRGVLRRQSGIGREGATEEPPQDDSPPSPSPEYIVPESLTVTLTSDSVTTSGDTLITHTESQSSTYGKTLQVPTVVVGSHQDKSPPYHSISGSSLGKLSPGGSKPLLLVPSSACGPSQVVKQRSHPEMMSRSYSDIKPQIKKQPSHPTVLSHTTTSVLPEYPNSSSTPLGSQQQSSQQQQQQPEQQQQQQQPLTYVPMQFMPKQRSSPGSLSSTQTLRPIQPKPSLGTDKDIPIIQFMPSEDEVPEYSSRFPRAISEETGMSRTLDHLSPGGPSQLTQSVSQDTGLDGSLAFVNRILSSSSSTSSSSQTLTVPKITSSNTSGSSSTSTPSSVAHSPVLREGPALGCNYCWNSQDNQGRVLRRKTKYHCPACRTNLCIVPCFHEYHSQMQMQQDQHKQITKILTKTSST